MPKKRRAAKSTAAKAGYQVFVSHATADKWLATTFHAAIRVLHQLSREPASAVERYGGSYFGKGCLLASRLIEAGVPFVEVISGGWDHHGQIYATGARGRDGIRPLAAQVDPAMAALVADLADRGLLDSTLVRRTEHDALLLVRGVIAGFRPSHVARGALSGHGSRRQAARVDFRPFFRCSAVIA